MASRRHARRTSRASRRGCWASRITRWRAITARCARVQRVPLTLTEDAQPFAVAEEADPQTVVAMRERWSEIVDALRLLTEEQRTVVVYRCALGYSTAEVAEMLGKPENAVRGLQFRALASLSRHLAAAERRQD